MSSRVLVIGDLHCPCVRKGYKEFCKAIYKKYKCNQTVFIGDVVDHQAISFYTKNPNMSSAGTEYDLAYKHIQQWYKLFHPAKVCQGNHDLRVLRVAESVGIPAKYLRNFKEIWNTPKWEWGWEFKIDGVYYTHGTGNGGIHPAYNMMRKMALSVVIGHNHHAAGIKFLVNPERRLFGLDVGTGIDDKQLAFAYGKFNKIRSVVSCGVVIDGHPYIELMPMSSGEEFHDKNF